MPCRKFIFCTIVFIKLFYAIEANAQFGGYYSTISGQSGTVLKNALNSIIDNHNSLSYTPGVWNAHKDLYEDPDNTDNIILFYSQDSIDKSNQDSGGSPDTYFNREHLWPRSYGIGNSGSDNTDLHHLVPVYKGVNSSRSNKYFDYSDPSLPGYENPANNLSPNCTANSDTFEPGDAQKGHVARAILYMATRYDYLEIVNTPPSSPPNTSSNRMAQLRTILDWNRKALPTVKEKNNNQKIYESYQYNRNPFIDFPEFADAIWVEGPSWGKWRLDNFSLQELNDLSMSADSADPDADGITNLMERAIYSDPKTINESPPIGIDVIDNNFVINFVRARDFENLNTILVLEKSVDLVNWNTIDLSSASTQVINDNQESVQLNLGPLNGEATTVTSTTSVTLVDGINALTPVDVIGDDSWNIIEAGNYAVINGWGGDYDEEDWLIFPEINLNDYTQEVLSLVYTSQWPDPSVTGLEIFFSNNYQLDPSSANWEEFASANSELDSNKSTDSNQTGLYNLEVDLSEIEGASITVGIKYTSIEQDPSASRAWGVAYPTITATGTINTTVEGNEEAVSYYRLRAENLGF
ncbi:MAG: endonuclease [Verrucomicrobiota bacterium]|nr:endonuclease [Verrucomicrobiota bacterium]